MYLIQGIAMEEEKTNFASAKRSTIEELLEEYDLVKSQKLITEIFGTIVGIAAIIDKNRQIVFANNDFLTSLGIETLDPILGKRLGEVISCIHSADEAYGCGTSLACAYCGAVNAILESQETGFRSSKETRITTNVNGKQNSLDLNVSSTPIVLAGHTYYVLMLQDISNEKRRNALERIFFHDLLNSAGGLNGILAILKGGTDPEKARELITISEEASRDMVEEIVLHRQIRSAENGDLQVTIEPVNSMELIESTIRKINSHEVGKNKQTCIAEDCVNIYFETDKMLLQRVIINLVKNALEATEVHGEVIIGAESLSEKVRFWVKNEKVIPENVKMQLFQRSFSTKGHGRGIGTYSIKLLTENYLKGKVSFISNESDRTIFSVVLNKIFPADIADQR